MFQTYLQCDVFARSTVLFVLPPSAGASASTETSYPIICPLCWVTGLRLCRIQIGIIALLFSVLLYARKLSRTGFCSPILTLYMPRDTTRRAALSNYLIDFMDFFRLTFAKKRLRLAHDNSLTEYVARHTLGDIAQSSHDVGAALGRRPPCLNF